MIKMGRSRTSRKRQENNSFQCHDVEQDLLRKIVRNGRHSKHSI